MTLITYEQFKEMNDNSKQFFDVLGTISDVSLKDGYCVLDYLDNSTRLPILQVVLDIYRDGMGAITNPSALKNWKGWNTVGV